MLGGNLNLSITMTTISTFAAFGMMPLWMFTLGRVIFDSARLRVPYRNIATFAVALVLPLSIGYVIQRYKPRLSKLMVRILKPFSGILILFIVIFAIITNLYMFRLFTWQILVAGLCLPWFGYFFGWIMAFVLKQSMDDALAIAIETGVQNTGISIFLLRFSLPQPEADLTTVVPVAVAIMTPIPMIILYIIIKCRTIIEQRKSPVKNAENLKKLNISAISGNDNTPAAQENLLRITHIEDQPQHYGGTS